MTYDVRDSFVRQRRALLAVSIVLAAYLAAGVQFGTLVVLGNTIRLTRPEWLPLGLWVLWVYTLLRYYQLRRDIADSGPSTSRIARQTTYVLKRARRFIEAHPPEPFASWRIQYPEAPVTFQFRNEEVTERSPRLWTLRMRLYGEQRETMYRLEEYKAIVPAPNRAERCRAWCYVAFHTRYFTEYDLPLLIAAVPLAAYVVTRLHAR